MGPPGTGKTTSLATLVKAGLSVRILFTEPGGEESFIDAMIRMKLPFDNVHWAYVAPGSTDWSTLEDMAKRITLLGYKDLSDLKTGIGKDKYRQFYELLATMANFKCARTGEELGPVDKFGEDCAFCLDSISGLNVMAKDLTVGAKPTMHQGEWGVAMNTEDRLIQKITSDVKCLTVCTAHVEKQRDEITGAMLITPSFLGNKLAPVIPRMFSDVILTVRENTNFFWSTAATGADLKARNLPISGKLLPEFQPIVTSCLKRKEAIGKPTE